MVIMSVIMMIRNSLLYYLLSIKVNLVCFWNHIYFLIRNLLIFYIHKSIFQTRIIFKNITNIFIILGSNFINFICYPTPVTSMSIDI
jgi:hypothetical protein